MSNLKDLCFILLLAIRPEGFSMFFKPKHKTPDKIPLNGDAAAINKKTNELIQEALTKGVDSDKDIFAQFEEMLSSHQAKYNHKPRTLN